jgi:large subunit ribosomal protein L3
MIQTILGKKLGQTQGFLEDGRRIPMTKIDVSGIVVSQVKTKDHEGYDAIQLGYGMNKKADKPTQGHAKKAGLNSTPRFFKESKVDKVEDVELGSPVNVEEILGAGDIVDVSGTSKGKGFAGGVKRHHFKGGPKTHGQSDRHRAPGSIGQSTTPGRVYKGKRMAGHMGVDQKTVKNLEVIDLTDGILLVKGLVPGHISSIVTITKRGVNKKAMGLYKEVVEEEILENAKVEEIGPSVEEQEEMRKETEAKAEEAEKAEAAEAQVANQVDKPEVEVTATEEVVSEPVEAVAEETPEIIAEETKEEEEAK